MTKTRRSLNKSVRGWKREKPGYHQKTLMLKKCGKKCFLGSGRSFPICTKNTCAINERGLRAAYIRARQYSTRGRKYKVIANKAKRMLTAKKYQH